MAAETTTCGWCTRPGIVVDQATGLMAPHRTQPKSRNGKPKGPACGGSNRHLTSQPLEATTP